LKPGGHGDWSWIGGFGLSAAIVACPQNDAFRVCFIMRQVLNMNRDLYEEIVDIRSRGGKASLATIVAQKGATPRRDAAKMLIYEDGHQLGSIGGGSTEAAGSAEKLIHSI
jgi:hypothetical protein